MGNEYQQIPDPRIFDSQEQTMPLYPGQIPQEVNHQAQVIQPANGHGQPMPYGQNANPQMMQPAVQVNMGGNVPSAGNGLGVAGFVLALVAVFLSWVPF